MLRLEALRVFVEVARQGNIRGAGERLLRTPSAVSMTLRQIEDRLGCALFETDRKTSLTVMGQFLFDQSVVLLRDYDRAMDRIEAQSRARSGRLRIAAVPSVATLLLPGFLQGFCAARPDLDIELVDTDSTDVRHLVETGQVDLGIAGHAPDRPGLESAALFRDPFRLVCRADSAVNARQGALILADLDEAALIVNEAMRGLTLPELQPRLAAARLSVRNLASLVAMVQAGLGVTLLPALATVNLPAALTARALQDPGLRRTVGVLTRAGAVPSPVARAFLQEFTAAARAQAERLGLEALR